MQLFIFTPFLLSSSVAFFFSPRWTGSNTNPNNNDGQGKEGTDRSNIVLLRVQNYPEGEIGQERQHQPLSALSERECD